MHSNTVHIVGGGLAGTEAAWQCLKAGLKVTLHEMRPYRNTEAHQTSDLGELVCSNSMKSMNPDSAPGLLKAEMTNFDSLIINAAQRARVPAGQALAVDRRLFSSTILEQLEKFNSFRLSREEITQLPSEEECVDRGEYWILATGPLTSDPMIQELSRFLESSSELYFYDAIAPIIDGDTIHKEPIFRGDRYGEPGRGDYLNIPLGKEEYHNFLDEILKAEMTPLHEFEKPKYFESCLPIEVMAARGVDTLRFGPLKPVGFTDPKTDKRPYAVIQLRSEDTMDRMFSMVGFQTKMKWPEQKRIFRKLPGLSEAEFYRLGSVHRNTFIHGPNNLNGDLTLRKNKRIRLAGQITGVEGYTESAAIGLLAGRFLANEVNRTPFTCPPNSTVMGALCHYVTEYKGNFQPMNANMGILEIKVPPKMSKPDKKTFRCKKSRTSFQSYLKNATHLS